MRTGDAVDERLPNDVEVGQLGDAARMTKRVRFASHVSYKSALSVASSNTVGHPFGCDWERISLSFKRLCANLSEASVVERVTGGRGEHSWDDDGHDAGADENNGKELACDDDVDIGDDCDDHGGDDGHDDDDGGINGDDDRLGDEVVCEAVVDGGGVCDAALPRDAIGEAEEATTPEHVDIRMRGYVPLPRGTFGQCEAQMKFHAVLAFEPEELENCLLDDFFWTGLSWLSVARCVFVQMVTFEDDGWNVSRRLRKRLVERAMSMHERHDSLVTGGTEVRDVLLGCGLKEKVTAIVRVPCYVCGCLEGTHRRQRGPGSEQVSDRRCYCSACLPLEAAPEAEAEAAVRDAFECEFDRVMSLLAEFASESSVGDVATGVDDGDKGDDCDDHGGDDGHDDHGGIDGENDGHVVQSSACHTFNRNFDTFLSPWSEATSAGRMNAKSCAGGGGDDGASDGGDETGDGEADEQDAEEHASFVVNVEQSEDGGDRW